MRAKLAKLSVDTRPLASLRSSTKARTQLRAASVISCSSVTSSRIPCTHRIPRLRTQPQHLSAAVSLLASQLACSVHTGLSKRPGLEATVIALNHKY